MTDFEEIYKAYFNDVLLYIRRLSKDEHIAEEITSETFFKAMRDIDSFRGECHILRKTEECLFGAIGLQIL